MSLKTIQQKYAAKTKTKTKRPTTGSRCGRLAKRRTQLEQDLAKTNAEYDAEVAALRESTEAAEEKVNARFAERSAKLEDEKQRELAQIRQRLECKIGEGKKSAKKASKKPAKKAGKKASKKPASKPAKKTGKPATAAKKTPKRDAKKAAEPPPAPPSSPPPAPKARAAGREPRTPKRPAADETVSPSKETAPACGTCSHKKPFTEADIRRGMAKEREHHPDLDESTLRQIVTDHLAADPKRYPPSRKPAAVTMSEQDKVNFAMSSLSDVLSNLPAPGR